MLSASQHERISDYLNSAWDSENPADRKKLARKILKIDPEELDAYLILAEHAATSVERLAMLGEAVRRGKVVWADQIKRPAQSAFWLDISTRPFMRCVYELSLAQWDDGDRSIAITNARFLLRINPHDSLGIRYLLMAWYPVIGDWDAFEQLLRKSRDECRTEYLYSSCLNIYRLGNASEASLIEALAANPFVPSFLNGRFEPPSDDDSQFPGYISMGSQSEALAYAHFSREGWHSVPGALQWLISEEARIVKGKPYGKRT